MTTTVLEWIIFCITLVIVVVNFFILVPINSSQVFYNYWEMLQVFHLMSYTSNKDSYSRRIFRSLHFVNLEFSFLPPFFTKHVLYFLFGGEDGIVLITKKSRFQIDNENYSKLKSAYESYFSNQKICNFLYDASSIIDILLICVGLSIVSNIIYYAGVCMFRSRDNKIVQLGGFLRARFGPGLYLRFFHENTPLIFFYYLSQAFFMTSDADTILDPYILATKFLGYIIFIIGAILLPIYSFS